MAEYINKLLLIKLIEDADCDVMADYGYEYGTEWGFSRDSIKILFVIIHPQTWLR